MSQEEVMYTQDDVSYAEGQGYEAGLSDAREGLQPVYGPHTDGEGPYGEPILFIHWFNDPGDPSVGIFGGSGWSIASIDEVPDEVLEQYRRRTT